MVLKDNISFILFYSLECVQTVFDRQPPHFVSFVAPARLGHLYHSHRCMWSGNAEHEVESGYAKTPVQVCWAVCVCVALFPSSLHVLS